MIEFLNNILTGAMRAIVFPVRSLDPWFAMVEFSTLSALLLLWIFRFGSNQALIRERKDRFVGRVLELALYKDDLAVTLGAFGRVLVENARYLAVLLKPLCIGLIPFVLLLAQAGAWFGARPFRPGETVVVKAVLAGNSAVGAVELKVPGNVEVEAGPVRVSARNEIYWRVRAVSAGESALDFSIGDVTVRKTLVVNEGLMPLNAVRSAGGLLSAIMYPAEPRLPAGSDFLSIAIAYPEMTFDIAGVQLNWALVYLVLTILIAWLLKGPLKVTI